MHLVYPPSRVVVFIQSAFDAGTHISPFKRGEIAVGVETRTFDVKGLHDKLYAFKRAQLPLLPGHLSSVYRAQVIFYRTTHHAFASKSTAPFSSFVVDAISFRFHAPCLLDVPCARSSAMFHQGRNN